MSQRITQIIVICFCAILVGIGFLGYLRWSEVNACQFSEKRLCRFVSVLKKEKFENVYGKYLIYQDMNETKVDYNFQGKSQAFSLQSGNNKSVDMVQRDSDIYISSPQDKKWYQQNLTVAENYEYDRPSGVQQSFLNIKNWLIKTKMDATLKAKTICQSRDCYEYELKNLTDEGTINLFIFDDGRMSKISIDEPGKKQDIEFVWGVKDIIIPSTFEKAGNENLYLKLILQKEQPKPTQNYQYVEKFQNEQKKDN